MEGAELRVWRRSERQRLLALRTGVPPAQRREWGQEIEQRLRLLLQDQPGIILGVYWPFQAEFDPRLLIGGQKRVEGFWLSEWARQQGIFTMLRLFRRIIRGLRAGVLTTEVGAQFPPEEIQQAVKLAETPGHKGKVLLRWPTT